MAADDKETTKSKRAKASGLPPRVERALSRAREAAKADRERKSGRWLAVFPVSVAVLLLLLMMPRATAPDAVPLPRIDARVLARVAGADDRRADSAEAKRLPSDVLAVGTALRALNGAEARGEDELGVLDARRNLDGALRDLGVRKDDVVPDLLALRALQTPSFRRCALGAHHETSADFAIRGQLSSAPATRVRPDRGAPHGHRAAGDARRVERWSGSRITPGVTLDEQRALYVYIARPGRPSRALPSRRRRSATTPEACAAAARHRRQWSSGWPTRSRSSARSIQRTYRLTSSAEAFTTFIGQSPDGPYALRAKNHLKAALSGGEL